MDDVSAGPAPTADEGLLREVWRILVERRRVMAAVLATVLAVVAARSFLTPPVYQGVAKLLIEREKPKVLSFEEVVENTAGDDYYQTQHRLLQSRWLARRAIEMESLLREPDFGGLDDAGREAAHASRPGESAAMESAIDALLASLSVQPERSSRLVNLVVESSRPDMAAKVANAVAEVYIEETLRLRYDTSADAGRWLEAQIREQRQKVEEADRALQELKEREGLVNIEERRALLDQRLRDLGLATTKLKTERLEKQVLASQMRQATRPEDLPEVMNNPVIQALSVELANLGRKEAQLGERYLDRYPEVVRVRRQIEDTRARLQAEARRIVDAADSEYRTAASQESSVLSALEAAKAEAEDLARRSVQYDSRKRELEAAKTVLDSLLARAKETDVTRELRASNIRIVDPAVVPRHPVRPRLSHDLLLGLIFGLGLATGLAFLLDHLDNTVKLPDDVRAYLRVPLLATIPEERSGTSSELTLLKHDPHGPFAEGYRLLRTALAYSWPDQSSRVVVVTSTLPGEGKTLTSMNLALALASSADVLLVDGDLRRAGVHTALDVPRSPGLTDVLVGRATVAEAILPVGKTRLSVLPAGSPAPSPADLLTGSALERLVADARRSFTWVIFDTPPVAAVSDPLVIASLSDGVLMVTGAEMASRTAVREAVRQVGSTGVRILGVVLNRVRFERHSSYYGAYHKVRGEYRTQG